jgi:hypothetical protein
MSMHKSSFASAMLALLALLAEPATRADDPAATERLVQQLGSKSFKEREAASKRLKEIGEPAWAVQRG